MVKLAHSFSSLKMYENCPLRYYYQRITKEVSDTPGEASLYGERVHKQLELRLKDGEPLPQETTKFEPLINLLERKAEGKTLLVEQELTLNEKLSPTGWWDDDAWMRSKLDVLIIHKNKAFVGDYKGLALDTLIPTPAGWTTMGDVSVGDEVFDAGGRPTTVVAKSEVKHLRCFEIDFGAGQKVVCDEEHLWKLHDGCVVGVDGLVAAETKWQRNNVPKISVAAAIDTPAADLPVDPYVLGLWLADGKRSSGEISKPDAFVWEEVQRRGYTVDMDTGGSKSCPTRTVKGLRTQLRESGLLCDKHIPAVYLRAGYAQRLALLQGLMDGDGSANHTRKQVVFVNTDIVLAKQVHELLLTLGQKPLLSPVTARGFGKAAQAYFVSFRPNGIIPFLLPRKAEGVDAWGPGHASFRYVKSVTEVATVPTQCIAVESKDHTFLCTEHFIPTHNTGKRRPDFTQLELFALQVFSHYPDVESVTSAFLWLKDNAIDKEVYTRDEAPVMWSRLLRRVHTIEDSLEKEKWPANPSGLCNYCPAKHICKYR